MCHSAEIDRPDSTETATHELGFRDQADRQADRLVPARLPKGDAHLQLLTSPVWEIQVVDRTGSGTYRNSQDVSSLVAQNDYLAKRHIGLSFEIIAHHGMNE